MRTQLRKNERGAALIETAFTIPIILLISVAIFEFGRAYQTWQVLTNAAREGARQAILTEKTDGDVTAAVENYLKAGGLPCVGDDAPPLTCSGVASVVMDRTEAMGVNSASRVTVNYPFTFIVLNPVVRLVTPTSETGAALTMQSVALMRNES
jgi:Flp pilus assembly protein TadG